MAVENVIAVHLRPAQLQNVTFGWIPGADCANTSRIERASRAAILDIVPCIVEAIRNTMRSQRKAEGFSTHEAAHKHYFKSKGEYASIVSLEEELFSVNTEQRGGFPSWWGSTNFGPRCGRILEPVHTSRFRQVKPLPGAIRLRLTRPY